MPEIGVDGVHEFTDAGEAAVSHDILGEVAEESLHEVHPRTGCRGEMQLHAVDAVGLTVALVVPL